MTDNIQMDNIVSTSCSSINHNNGDVPHYDVAIIGGGIAGLSTAWYLQQQSLESGVPVNYVLLERGCRWGGKIKTDNVKVGRSSYLIEGGPDSFITQKPEGLQMARELGLDNELLNSNEVSKLVYVLKNGKPLSLPDGVLLIIPTQFMPFALSPLISLRGKLRMGMDLFIRGRQDDGDETLADFVRRRLGKEALDRIAEPLMAGIYNAEAERQSVMATFPRFRAIEKQYGSLIKGMLAAKSLRVKAEQARKTSAAPANKPVSMFVSLNSGTSSLVESMISQLTGDLKLKADVETITSEQGDREQGTNKYILHMQDGSRISAYKIVMATPAFCAADMIKSLISAVAAKLEQIRYVSTGTISLAFKKEDVPRPVEGFGLVVPRSENRPINALTCSSIKWKHRAPDDHLLMRIFFGGSRHPEMMELNDGELFDVIREELFKLMGITVQPELHRIYRWHQGNPQYDVGHLDHVAAIEAALPAGIFITGSAYRGIGIPDCAAQGKVTAGKVIAELNKYENDNNKIQNNNVIVEGVV